MFNLTSAPVMLHLEHDPSLYKEIDKGTESVQNVDYAKVSRFLILEMPLRSRRMSVSFLTSQNVPILPDSRIRFTRSRPNVNETVAKGAFATSHGGFGSVPGERRSYGPFEYYRRDGGNLRT